MDVGGWGGEGLVLGTFLGEKLWKIAIVENLQYFVFVDTKYKKIQHFRKCIYILSIFVCSLLGPGPCPKCTFKRFII